MAWLLGALRAGGPYPVLAIAGEQGPAKTVLSKLLRTLIDPSVAPVRALPRNERELFIAANNGHILAFDNLSGLPPWLSDTLCRDRAILLMLAPIAEWQRRPEHALLREFQLARPHILGALLDAAAHGLHMLPHVRLQRLPRMADFALWATACESAFRPAGTLEAAYSNNRRDAIENVIDADPVAALVREIMANRAQWTGSASELLQIGTNRSGWPKGPRALAGRLRRAQTFLRTLGIEIVFGRGGRLGTRTIRITALDGNRPSAPSVASATMETGRV